MPKQDFEISDTKKEAEWVQQPWPLTNFWQCGNCKHTLRIQETTWLRPFCCVCGFKMKNPQLIKVEYDYGY